MNQEIERKYLVNERIHEVLRGREGEAIQQGYVCSSPEKTVRVRTKGARGYITLKGKTNGISRAEYEYEVPLAEAQEMLALFCDVVLAKVRYEIEVAGKTWEVDVFQGKLDGLIVAELELEREDEAVTLPEWIAEEVSHDPAYYNSNLIKRA